MRASMISPALLNTIIIFVSSFLVCLPTYLPTHQIQESCNDWNQFFCLLTLSDICAKNLEILMPEIGGNSFLAIAQVLLTFFGASWLALFIALFCFFLPKNLLRFLPCFLIFSEKGWIWVPRFLLFCQLCR